MANAVAGVPNVQQTSHTAEVHTAQTSKQAAPSKAAAPEDKVSISNEAKAASHAQAAAKPQQSSGGAKK